MWYYKYEELGGERKLLVDLVNEARDLHAQEDGLVLRSIRILFRLERLNAAGNFLMHHEEFARYLGLTIDQYYKRKRVGQMMHFFPEIEGMLERRETTLTNLVSIAPKLTQANKHILLEGIKGATKKEAELLASRVTPNGNVLDQEETVQITITLTKDELNQLERAREILASHGQNPSHGQVISKALNDLLEKRDPLRRAARANERANKKGQKADTTGTGRAVDQSTFIADTDIADTVIDDTDIADTVIDDTECRGRTGSGTSCPPQHQKHRPAVPARIKHAVYLRDHGQCTFRYSNGERCPSKSMLEIDHKKPWSLGGDHKVDNLRLLCREHNQLTAQIDLGICKYTYAKIGWQTPQVA
jgi:hypothetical protein